MTNLYRSNTKVQTLINHSNPFEKEMSNCRLTPGIIMKLDNNTKISHLNLIRESKSWNDMLQIANTLIQNLA